MSVFDLAIPFLDHMIFDLLNLARVMISYIFIPLEKDCHSALYLPESFQSHSWSIYLDHILKVWIFYDPTWQSSLFLSSDSIFGNSGHQLVLIWRNACPLVFGLVQRSQSVECGFLGLCDLVIISYIFYSLGKTLPPSSVSSRIFPIPLLIHLFRPYS